MPATFLAGDLFAASLPALAHGCNCAGAMGKGIAVEFRSRFPRMYAEYKQRCTDKRFTPGSVFAWREDDVTIFNLGTQKTWRTPATLPAIETSVREMVRLASAANIARIGMPRIRCRARWPPVANGALAPRDDRYSHGGGAARVRGLHPA